MAGQIVTINSRKYDQSIRRSWLCELIDQADGLMVFAGTFDQDVTHPDLGHITRGTTSYEYYWLDRWYNIFRFHEPDGSFRNYYCNISMPPSIAGDVVDYVDLDIDIVVWPDATFEILDESEFVENAALFNYPESVRLNVSAALGELLSMIRNNQLPKGQNAATILP